jgi:polysaccharide deacetylase 2 family uncharacterized protein YibQ
MAARRSASKNKSSRRGGPSLPLWLLGLLVLALAAAVVVRLRVVPPPGRPPSMPPPPSRQEPRQAPKAKPKREVRAPFVAEPETPQPAPGARPLPPAPPSPSGIPTVALVIDDVGYRMDLVEEAVRGLPPTVTFAIIPFLPYSEESAERLHESGFPVILHCPMEPEHPERWKPTQGTLTVGLPASEVRQILLSDLQAVPHAEGINNHMGSLATSDGPLMAAVMDALKPRGLYFLDSRTTVRTVAYETARARGVKAAFRSVFLDDADDESAIMKQFDQLVARAGQEGMLVGIGHLRPRTLAVLAERIPYWSERGVKFAPLREVVR